MCEVTMTKSLHYVRVQDVLIGTNKDKLMFVLHTSKTHNKGNKPQIIKISATKKKVRDGVMTCEQKWRYRHCPFKLINDYITVHKRQRKPDEPFFVFSHRSPVTDQHFRKVLKSAIDSANIDSNRYNSQGLRAGRAVELLELGVSVETIRKIGRWKSNVIYTYLR